MSRIQRRNQFYQSLSKASEKRSTGIVVRKRYGHLCHKIPLLKVVGGKTRSEQTQAVCLMSRSRLKRQYCYSLKTVQFNGSFIRKEDAYQLVRRDFKMLLKQLYSAKNFFLYKMANFRDTFYREKLIFIKDRFDVIKPSDKHPFKNFMQYLLRDLSINF